MKTLAQIIAWLKTPERRPNILVEISGVQGGPATLYLSSKPFVTSTTDTPSNTRYDPCIIGGAKFSENLSLNNTVSISYGDIEIENVGGKRDDWFTYVWANRNISILIGDITWNRTDYRSIFEGVIADISSRNLSTINIVILNKLQKLNNPVSEALLPLVNSITDVIIPTTFGEVFNVTPIVTDNIVNTLEYQVHTGPIENIIEVRDNGVPVSITKNLSQGKFNLNQSPYGTITCSVQGHKNPTYYNDAANLIKQIVKNFGPTATRLTDSDIDLSNFSAFSAANSQSVGIYSSNSENILSVCNQLASSVGGQLTMTSTGLLRLVKLAVPGTGVAYTVSANDIAEDSVTISDKPDVRAATKIGYAKNYTLQQGNIAAGIPSQNVTLFETDYLYATAVNSTVQSDYRLTVEPDEENTLLNSTAAAEAEATRRNTLWSTARYVYTFKAYPHLLPVELGDAITLYDSRFGLSAGKTGTAISIARDWVDATVTIGVLI